MVAWSMKSEVFFFFLLYDNYFLPTYQLPLVSSIVYCLMSGHYQFPSTLVLVWFIYKHFITPCLLSFALWRFILSWMTFLSTFLF